MWIAKLFGSRKPSTPTQAVAPVRKVAASNTLKVVPAEKKQKGFDPYNSGAYKKENAWERVIRR